MDKNSPEFKETLRGLLREVAKKADEHELNPDEHYGEYERDSWMLGRIIEASGLDIRFDVISNVDRKQ